MDQKVFKKVLEISEQFFGTQTDPDQMPITQKTADKLASIHPDTVIYKFDEQGEPIAWAVVVPTSLATKDKFLAGKMTERELLDEAARERRFDALYLCAAFVLPEYRRKGYARELVIEAINKVSGGKEIPLYSWIYSPEGKKLVDTLSRELGREIAHK
jgi:GNAT superfamily N-acetyltransferase